ncbi:porimin [Pimephales promelas]|uniref:porimin n=1 Tax=Pimephales promelas TaxID=90988 RepID=UPI0019557629|nr:porimin [Pimephales promelas]
MNRCLCLILIKSCLVLSLVMRTVQTHPDEGETVTGSDMSKTTLAPKAKAELISSTNPSLNTELITTQSKPLIPASTGVPPGIPTAGFRFHAGSFVGGMALAVIITLAVALGYRLACSQREVRYRAIEEHDAII